MYIYMYIDVCIYTCIYIPINVYTYIVIYIYMCIYTYVSEYMSVYIYMSVCLHICISPSGRLSSWPVSCRFFLLQVTDNGNYIVDLFFKTAIKVCTVTYIHLCFVVCVCVYVVVSIHFCSYVYWKKKKTPETVCGSLGACLPVNVWAEFSSNL